MTTQAIKEKVRTVINWIDLIKGMKTYKQTNVTPDKAYQAMIRLHGRTNGKSTRWLANQYADRAIRYQPTQAVSGVLGQLEPQQIADIVATIQNQGFYVFEEVVPADICQQIEQHALSTPAMVENDSQADYQNKKVLFDPENPISKTYKIPEEAMIQHPMVQDLMADESIRAIVKAYVKRDPVLASVNSWFSPVYQPNQDGGASAQNYHFDMSRCRWLNVFLYLSDVDASQGPHCFIKHSHQPNSKQSHKLLKRGYVRIPDQDIYQAYGKDKEVQFIGKKGTIIIEDTIGFHKGKTPQKGYRSIFELVFAVNLFGGKYHTFPMPKILSPKLIQAIQQSPQTYQRYIKNQ